MFSSATYQQRRRELAQRIGKGLILLPGNLELPFNYSGNTYPFRQDSTFLYYVGLDEPELHVLIDATTGETHLFGDDTSLEAEVWTGPRPTLASKAAAAGISHTHPPDAWATMITAAQEAGTPVHFLFPYQAELQLRLSEILGITPRQLKDTASEDLIHAVFAQRAYKTPAEIEEIEKALTTTARMHLAAMRTARPGMQEAEVMAAVAREAHVDHVVPAYGIILSVRGEVLHNHHYLNTLTSGQLLLIDAGAESPRHYAGDITRTIPVDSTFTPRQRDLYDVVLAAHETAAALLRPGISYRTVHDAAALQIAQGLTRLGLMQGDPAAAVEAGAHALFFVHGLGHMLGLDVHDMENLGEQHIGYTPDLSRSPDFGTKYLRLARQLEAGFVLTVEPGIYFIPALIRLWERENKFRAYICYDRLDAYLDTGGIRIEDNYLITPEGARRLGPYIPRTAAEIEAERALAW